MLIKHRPCPGLGTGLLPSADFIGEIQDDSNISMGNREPHVQKEKEKKRETCFGVALFQVQGQA